MTRQFGRSFDNGRNRPPQRRDACQQAEFVVDIVSRLVPTTQDKPFTSSVYDPVLIEPSAKRSHDSHSEPFQDLVIRLNRHVLSSFRITAQLEDDTSM